VSLKGGYRGQEYVMDQPSSMPNARDRQVLYSNRLLQALSPSDLNRISRALTRRRFAARAPLHALGEDIQTVFFVESGMASVSIATFQGESVEIAAVGREGFVGVPVVIGFTRAPAATCFQIPGETLAMTRKEFVAEMKGCAAFHNVVMSYARARYVQMAQTILCNQRHTIEQRLARWLLMAHDYAGLNQFPLTQQLISEMLGVHRPAVTVAARLLQTGGVVEYRRGVVDIHDLHGLERAACSCYRIVREQYELLLPPAFSG
jgi:CRP-like cAMP-binding protein